MIISLSLSLISIHPQCNLNFDDKLTSMSIHLQATINKPGFSRALVLRKFFFVREAFFLKDDQ